MNFAIGIPAFNEEKNIASLIIQLKKKCELIIICNDGSTDNTSKIAEELGVIVINHEKNLGYGAAIKSIFNKAKEMEVECLVTFDADGQHRIEDISKTIQPIKEKKADIVIGSRFLESKVVIPKYRKIGIKVITNLTNSLTGEKISDSQSGFRAYNNYALNSIILSDSGMGISTEILIKASKKEMKIIEVPIIVNYEGNTSTHNPISHASSVILSTVKFVAIQRPLTFYGIPGIIFLLIGLFFIGWTVQLYVEDGGIITNITIIGIGCVLVGIILLVTATILYSIIILIKEK
jgi:glycosyltransferase involved in cell wall biosynthesis